MGTDGKHPFEDDTYFDGVEMEIRRDRKYSIASALGEQGGGFIASGTSIAPTQQVASAVETFLDAHLVDHSVVLRRVLGQRVTSNIVLLADHIDAPTAALAHVLDHLLEVDQRLFEFVRQVDAEYGRMMDERPHFQKPGDPEHPDDPYTHASVRTTLMTLRAVLSSRG